MSHEDRDPLRDVIKEAADQIDTGVVLDQEVDDPVIGLLQYELLTTADAEEAIANVVESLASASELMLGVLDFPPGAIGGSKLAQRVSEAGVPEHVASAAFNYLLRSGQIDEINGWYFRVPHQS